MRISSKLCVVGAVLVCSIHSAFHVTGQVGIRGRYAELADIFNNDFEYPIYDLPYLDNDLLERQEKLLRGDSLSISDNVHDESKDHSKSEHAQLEEGKWERVLRQKRPEDEAAVDALSSFLNFLFGSGGIGETAKEQANNDVAPSISSSKFPNAGIDEKDESESSSSKVSTREEKSTGPYRFGRKINVNIDVSTHGSWHTLPAGLGRVWKMGIRSPTALSLNLIFDKFKLPEGAELYIRGDSQIDESSDPMKNILKSRTGNAKDVNSKMILGAFTAAINNKPSGLFATSPLPTRFLVLEYFEPNDVTDTVVMHLSNVVHGFRRFLRDTHSDSINLDHGMDHFLNNMDNEIMGPSGRCNINVACQEAVPWRDQVRATVILLTSYNSAFCSASMINNALNNGKQYLLTARHCVSSDGSAELNSIVGFNYQSGKCGSNNHDWPMQTANGLTLKAMSSWSDFALFEVQEMIPDSFDVFLAGWSRSTVASPRSVGIHHPSGDVKKISFCNTELDYSCWDECGANKDLHWKVIRWTNGTTEPGSSGSPLFDVNGYIVGQLHGGSASCYNSYGYDLYGAIYASYDYMTDPTESLQPYLNPNNAAIDSWPGINLDESRQSRK